MRKLLVAPLFLLGLSISVLSVDIFNIDNDESPKLAPQGMVAYAASYSGDVSSEPQYTTQFNKTFQYLNLGNTFNYYRGDSVKVGIIDSGINYDHEDFMVSGSTKVKGESKYYSYQSSSWVYYKASQHGYSYIDDSLGHGTNVAATVAAAVNSVGGLGLAPNVELYVYKVTNSNNGYEFGAIQNALMDAKTLGIDVINMSFQSYEHAVSYGGSTMPASSGCSTILSYYLNQAYNAGITLVGAAGNYNTDEPSYPGSNNHVINVGSLSQDGTAKAPFSNYGSTIDLVAPGYVHVADKGTNSSYKDTQGTSFSAPLVTAAIALYKQKNPDATPSQIETALYASCDPILNTNWAGHGALNLAKFLDIPEPSEGPTDIIINNSEVIDNELTLKVGQTFDLDWTVNGTGTFDDSVNFYTLSGEDDVVSVDSNGQITANGIGEDYVIIESNIDSNVYTDLYIKVEASRTVIEETTTYTSSTISWPSNATASISGDLTGVSVSLSGKTNYENSSMRLGTGSGGGTLTISSNSTICKVDISAKYYSSSYQNSTLVVDGQNINPLTASYQTYSATLASPKTSFTILTTSSSNRVNIQSVVIYHGETTKKDISDTPDCLGLEAFIDTYMHMDYVANLGYCSDSEHHYYATARDAFNLLNDHQRKLFTSNSAYELEWVRLQAWARANFESLNSSDKLEVLSGDFNSTLFENDDNTSMLILIISLSACSLLFISLVISKKRRGNK